MRTIIDLPEEQIEALKLLAERENASRAELVRRAVSDYLAQRMGDGTDGAFGIWRKRGEGGLEYEARIRQEWDR
ncbi:MAG: CopG family transcriptional regulator [Thioalkalivibrio sp.]|nr:MAG: CopG family transcriptional regulator [Thioalkalivibrio sp.]